MTQEDAQKGGGPIIWVVDGRSDVLDLVQNALDGRFDRCQYFADPRRALLHARREVPHLVILGLAQNTIGPCELLALRREFDATADVPVLALYGDDDVVEVEEVMGSGVVDAVAIGDITDELLTRVRWQFLRRQPLEITNDELPVGGLSALRTFDFLTRVIEASPNAIVAARRSGEIVLFNPAAEHILGWSEEEALQMSVRRLYPADGAERIMRMIRSEEFGGRGQIDSLREVVVNSDGELIPVEISAALVHEDNEEIATVGIFTDLRQQVRMEQRLQESIEALEQTQRQAVVAEVAGTAAHELNQPLMSLLGYAELLRRKVDEDSDLHRVVETIHRDASRIAEVVRKIGRITRYRTRDYPGGEQIVDLEEASEAGDVRETGEFDEQGVRALATQTMEMNRVSENGYGEGD